MIGLSGANEHGLIVVMPVYEDRESASRLLTDLADACPERPYIVAVEDGSVIDPLPVSAISEAGLSGEVLTLARNMGHQRAIAVGLCHVATHFPNAGAVVVMDSDGEDRPQSIAPMLEMLRAGEVDVVVAERRRRSETLSFRLFYMFYRLIFQIMTGRTIRFGNFTAMSRRSVQRLAAMQELWVHLPASIIISRLRVGNIATDRGTRYAGQSRMSFVALALHGLRSMMVVAEDVLVRVGVFCTFLSVVALFLLAASVVMKLTGFATPGWFTAASGVLILILMQAAVLTFVTLMVAGLIRGTPPITKAAVEQLIASVEKTRTPARFKTPAA